MPQPDPSRDDDRVHGELEHDALERDDPERDDHARRDGFALEDLQTAAERAAMEADVRRACEAAVRSPLAQFVFIDRYTRWNGYAGALVAKLAGNIGQSQDLFLDPAEPDLAQAVRGMDIARHVLDATIDEHLDKGHRVAHRTLAQAMRKAAADYAGLDAERRNALSVPPLWLQDVIARTFACYGGVAHDAEALLRALGTHIASESLADREYAIIDRVFRAERHHVGFYQYLRERDFRVELNGRPVHAYAWITLHATFDSEGVEAEHLAEAMHALEAAARYRPEPRERVLALARQGYRVFADIQRDFFAHVERECLAADAGRPLAA